MELIKNKTFGGERPLFGAHDARLEDITITDGESGIKCCKNIECHNSKFYGKYPCFIITYVLLPYGVPPALVYDS